MTLGELAKETGYTEATIKFFLREGLLRPGKKLHERRSEYDARHVGRLRLIDALHTKLGLSYHEVKQVTEVLDAPGVSMHDAVGLVQWLITPMHSRRHTISDLPEVLQNNGIVPANKRYVENLAGTMQEAEHEGIVFDHTLESIISHLKSIVRLEMNSGIVDIKDADEYVRYCALGMHYMSSVSLQLMRMIEQTMAREVMQDKEHNEEEKTA